MSNSKNLARVKKLQLWGLLETCTVTAINHICAVNRWPCHSFGVVKSINVMMMIIPRSGGFLSIKPTNLVVWCNTTRFVSMTFYIPWHLTHLGPQLLLKKLLHQISSSCCDESSDHPVQTFPQNQHHFHLQLQLVLVPSFIRRNCNITW